MVKGTTRSFYRQFILFVAVLFVLLMSGITIARADGPPYEPGCYSQSSEGLGTGTGEGLGTKVDCPAGYDFKDNICYEFFGTSDGSGDVTALPYDCETGKLMSGSGEEIFITNEGQDDLPVVETSFDEPEPVAGSESLENEEPQTIAADCTGDILSADSECGILRYLVAGINFLSTLAAMAIIASLVFAGFQYMTARDSAGQVEAAKKRIYWALAALGLFLFMYAILNWLVPGGVL